TVSMRALCVFHTRYRGTPPCIGVGPIFRRVWRSPWPPSTCWSSGMAYGPTHRVSCPSRSRNLVCKIPMSLLGLSETNTIGYYIIMRLPGEPDAEFFLMLPMVPSKRDNMIAWLAARCDLPQYGKLIVYEFPKEKQVYGPFQIEARINQNTEISQQISLWNQTGSRVIRGNLLVIPIETSILYVSPLYLRAETGQLP